MVEEYGQAYIKVDRATERPLKVEYEEGNLRIFLGCDGYLSLEDAYIIANKDEAWKLCRFIQSILQDRGV